MLYRAATIVGVVTLSLNVAAFLFLAVIALWVSMGIGIIGGGRDFGGFPAPDSPLHIISRNLTPDASGKPEGHSLEEFITILRTGVDMDQRHPNCPTGVTNSSCTPFPFDGSKLQIMRWVNFRNMTDRQLTAVYQYLSAIPCIQGADPNEPPNRCQ